MSDKKLMKCPLCEDNSLIPFTEPIEYWGCKKCRVVLVRDEEGAISMLDQAVEYIG